MTPADQERLEALRKRMGRMAAESAAYTPALAATFNRVGLAIKDALDAHTAAQWGLANSTTVRRAAIGALAALNALEERRRAGKAEWTPEYVAEYAALSRLAEVTVEFDERVADD